MSEEVRYHMLRPEQVLARRKACPVAYVPIGTLEWHGLHNPFGADTLQAEGIAILCAQKGGGLVFPPLYYGENRLECLMEANAADRELIAEKMGLAPENFTAAKQPFSVTEQMLNYNKLLLHILAEVETLGFELAVLIAGHYPLIDHARAAVVQYNQRNHNKKDAMRAWAFVDYMLVQDKYAVAGDHAGGWETSHLMALHPSTVDLSRLPPKGEKLIGCGGKLAPQDSSAEFGRETLEAAADIAVREVKHRLENKRLYGRHGESLREGLWRTGAQQPADVKDKG
jgi:creatinine amidohydrolase